MIPLSSRRMPLAGACVLVFIGAGMIAATAQARQEPAPERQFAAAENPAPLKLPPLPPKKFPTKKFGDWTQRCDTRPGVPGQQCFLTQTIVQTKDQRKHGLLAVTVGLIGPDKKPGMVLRVPLGLAVLLPPGFKLNVPGIEPIRIAILSCLANGCSAKLPLSPDTIEAMKKADAGSVELKNIGNQVIRVPVSFKGFSAALESLSKG